MTQRLHTQPLTAGGHSASPGPGIHLRVIGFGQQDVVDTTLVVRAVKRLPAFHLHGLNELRYDPPLYPFAHCIGDGRPPPLAEYLQRERCVCFYRIESREQFLPLLYHEIGHHVFFIVLSSRIKKQWVTEVSPASGTITPYAAHNPSEDFAETYAAFALDPESLRRLLPAKAQFMHQHVFSDRPENRKEGTTRLE